MLTKAISSSYNHSIQTSAGVQQSLADSHHGAIKRLHVTSDEFKITSTYSSRNKTGQMKHRNARTCNAGRMQLSHYYFRLNLPTTPAQKDFFHRASSTLSAWKNSCLPECRSTEEGRIHRVPLKTFQQAKFRAKMARPTYLSTKVLDLK